MPDDDETDDTYKPGIDFRPVDLLIDGLRLRTQIWDTAGQERYRTMTKMYFRGAKGILLVFDVTDRSSFDKISDWMTSLKEVNLDCEEIFLIGNKVDLTDSIAVKYQEGYSAALTFGLKYFEMSARTGEGVKETLDKLIHNMKDKNHPNMTGLYRIIGGEVWEKNFSGKQWRDDDRELRLSENEVKWRRKPFPSRCC